MAARCPKVVYGVILIYFIRAPQILRRNKQRKSPLKSTDFRGIWSEWGDSNSQHLAPKASALPIALHPVISFSLPRLVPGIFLSVGIPVVNRKFSAKSNPRQSHVFARVSTRSGLSQTTPWMPLSIVPKQARYQLRYTRILNFCSCCLWSFLWPKGISHPVSP